MKLVKIVLVAVALTLSMAGPVAASGAAAATTILDAEPNGPARCC